jgi:PAS domain S-box-containing protein
MLTTSLISRQYSKSASLNDLQNFITLATKISRFVHSTQIERGLSSGYISSDGKKFHNKLLNQREITDKKAKELYHYLNIIEDKNIVNMLNSSLNDLKLLRDLREDIDSLGKSAKELINSYSKINENFLNIVIEISKKSQNRLITQNILAYNDFLHAKENAGLERAIGTIILSKDKLTQNEKISFSSLISIQKIYMSNFLKFASDKAKIFFNKTFKAKEIDNVEKIREIILYKPDDEVAKISAEYWFENMTVKIDKLQLMDNYLEKEILCNINKKIEEADKLFIGFAILNILSIIMFLFMMFAIIKLIKTEKRLKNIVDKYVISSSTDLKGYITEVSDAFCDISGYTREELIGKPHNIIRHPDMPKSAFKDLWESLKREEAWSGEVKNLKKDGGYYWVYANIEPLFDKSGDVEGYTAIRLDITDSIHLEEELKLSRAKDKTLLHQSKLAQMGEMISMIAHQWRQPLTAISSTSSDLYLKVMLDQYDRDYFDEKLEKIDELSQHLSKTINDFRTFYKEDKTKENVSYNDVIKNVYDIVMISLENKKIDLKSDFRSQKKIETFPNELRQVILNLIKNAEDVLIEKELEDAWIKVETYDDDEFAYLEVSDNAGGIDPEIMEKIFDPYFSTKIQQDGTGLGLYMSKTIVQEHSNGSLRVKNTKDGALFSIKIPFIKEREDV